MNQKKIENLLITKQDDSSIIRIIVECSILKQKLENPENKSWYFKRGIVSRKKRIISLKKEFGVIRKIFNKTTIDTFIKTKNKNLTCMADYEKHGMGFIKQIHYSNMLGQNVFYNELIRLKSKTELMKDIDFYLTNPEEFLVFIN